MRTFRTSAKAGKVAAARVVTEGPGQLILIISAKAQVVRITLEDVRVTGRNTQGVIVWRDREPDDQVASIAVFQESDTLASDGDEASNGKKASKPKNAAPKDSDQEEAETEDVDENEDELVTGDVEETGDEDESDADDDEADTDDESEETSAE